jgi:hypothetical protein
MKTVRIITVLFLFIYPVLLAQTTYYVSNSQGNDSNNGTSQNNPWKTVSKVNSSNFNSGDQILFRRGDTWDNDALLLINSGHTGIRVGNYGSGELPIIRGGTSWNANCYITKQNIVIDGIYFRGSSTGIGAGTSPRGVHLTDAARGVTIKNCKIEGDEDGSPRSDAGILVYSRNVTIEFNEIYWHLRLIHSQYNETDTSLHQNLTVKHNLLRDTRTLGANDGDCIKFSGGGNSMGTVVSYNEMKGWSDDAVDGRAINLLIEYNVLHSPQTSASGANGICLKSSSSPQGGEQSTGGIVRYNILRDWQITTRTESSRGWAIVSGSSNQQIYNNLLYNLPGFHGIFKDFPHDNIKIYNNTIWNVGGLDPNGSVRHAVYMPYEGGTNVELRNNIIKGMGGVYKDVYFGNTCTATNNIYVNNNVTYTGNSNVTSANNLSGNPAFVDLNNDNFRLAQSDVLARDNGFNISLSGGTYSYPAVDLDSNAVPQNSIYDIGSYEYTNSPPGGSDVRLNIKILLEGPYNGSSLATDLNTANTLPLNQPYNAAPWNYSGNETVTGFANDIVDWVLLELRSGTAGSTIVARRAALIKSNGTVVDLDGTSKVLFNGVTDGSYYVVVTHRNHIPVMSAGQLSLTDNSNLYDFTTVSNNAYGDEPQADLGGGKWGLYAGDGDYNNLVNVIDYGTVGNFLFETGYKFGDLDMNGVINVIDYGKTNQNLFRSSQVPN